MMKIMLHLFVHRKPQFNYFQCWQEKTTCWNIQMVKPPTRLHKCAGLLPFAASFHEGLSILKTIEVGADWAMDVAINYKA